jgi:hypothetical protein
MIFQHENSAFRKWLANHPEGYYVNKNGSPVNHKLHKSQCPHLPKADSDPRGPLAVTNVAKQVFENKQELRAYLDNIAVQPQKCRTCNPL